MGDSEVSAAVSADASAATTPTTRKKLKRVRKVREPDDAAASVADAIRNAEMGAGVWETLTSSKLYVVLVLIRLLLAIFSPPAVMEGTEFADGVDVLAMRLLPGMGIGGADSLLGVPPDGMGDVNRTRSIVGAFVSSGIPYVGVNVACKFGARLMQPWWCQPAAMGYVAVYAPRIWMFFLSLIGDVLLVKIFAVYEGESALSALLTYASAWTTLLGMTRNTNFALESLCLVGLVASCFGWAPGVARPLFWLGATSLSLGIYLRPIFAVFVCTPIIYLSSLWGKQGIDALRYVRGALEGIAVFAFWCTIWVSVDSVFFGTFKLRFGGIVMENFDMFVEYAQKGLPFSYKGSLVYTPLNAAAPLLTKAFWTALPQNTSPGQMFLSLPAILGPLFIVLIRESYEGMKVAVKELMTEIKTATGAGKKTKKRKNKKLTKEREEELLVFFDTIQTTFLLGLLLEVLQNNSRLGVISLMALMPPAVVCIAGTVFGPGSSTRFRWLHCVFTVGMVVFYGFLNNSGISSTLISLGAGGVPAIPANSDIVFFKGIIGHRAALGANLKNVSMHDGGNSRLALMTTLRELKAKSDYHEDRLIVAAAGTVDMKESEFTRIGTVAYGHMTVLDLPENIDEALKRSTLQVYKFIGDEDEAIIRDDEEAAEEEEAESEERRRAKEKKQRKKKGDGEKEEL